MCCKISRETHHEYERRRSFFVMMITLKEYVNIIHLHVLNLMEEGRALVVRGSSGDVVCAVTELLAVAVAI